MDLEKELDKKQETKRAAVRERKERERMEAAGQVALALQGYLAHKKTPTPLALQGYLAHKKTPTPLALQGYLAHKKTPPPLGPP